MATPGRSLDAAVAHLGNTLFHAVSSLGDWALFSLHALGWLLLRRPSPGTLAPIFYFVGVRSVAVVVVTGAFIGMVFAVQVYGQFHRFGMDTRLGSIINVAVVRELGPVLAATMLAGRVGSAMAAELATMRVTEQVDALACLGANPIRYLVVPRFLACVLLIPLLTVIADVMGILGGAAICIFIYNVDAHHYWSHARDELVLWDLLTSLVKAMFFGGALSLISCQRGFNSRPGAEGVGRAATEAFVMSFIAILALDFVLALFLNNLYEELWPTGGAGMGGG